jgi:TetR/AcrR family transcriptional regulator, transcriptional repressor for nem operon
MIKARTDSTTLIEKGLELMYLRGYNDVSIKDLVDAAGMPKGSFYNHFKSKEHFGLAVLERYGQLWHGIIQQYLADRTLPARTRFERFFDHMISSYETEYKYTKGCLAGNFSQEMGDVNPHFAECVDRVFRGAEIYFVNAVRDGQREGSVDPKLDPERTAEFLLNAFEGAMVRMKSARSSEPLLAFRTLVFSTIIR